MHRLKFLALYAPLVLLAPGARSADHVDPVLSRLEVKNAPAENGEIAQGTPQVIKVEGVRNVDEVSYRKFYKGMQVFSGNRQLAPDAALRSKLKNLPQSPMQPAAPLRSTIYRAGSPFPHKTVQSRMQVLAEIDQGRRTVLEYLLSPVRKTVSEAGCER